VDDVIDRLTAELGDVSELQARAAVEEVRGEIALARGEFEASYRTSIGAFRLAHGPDSGELPRAARAAAWLGDVGAVRDTRQLMDGVPGSLPAAWRLEMDGAIAALEGRRGDAMSLFLDAFRRMRDLGLEYERAVAAVFIVKLLGADTPELREAIEEAEATLRRLGAAPMLERVAEARAAGAKAQAGAGPMQNDAARRVSSESRTAP
jgi:hypothetical protein